MFLQMTYPENRRVHENAVKMMAADVLVDAANISDASANNAWFQHKERLTTDEAVAILSEAGVATFSVETK